MPQSPAPKPQSMKPAAASPSAPATTLGDGVAPPSPPESSGVGADASTAPTPPSSDKEQAEDHGEPRAPHCPECNARMDKYAGDNPYKQSTAVCPQHGRMSVYRNKVVA